MLAVIEWFDSWLRRKPRSNNWASSQLHLALLERFLSARDAENGVPDFWAPAFGMSPQRIIDGMVADGALELAPLLEKIEISHTVAELKKILSSRGLKVSGKKVELARRLLEADPKGMEIQYLDRMILRCTPVASQFVSRWKAEQAKAFEAAIDNVITALRNRHFKEAIRTADAYCEKKFKPPVHPGVVAMTIEPAQRSTKERTNDLATVFTMRPKILEGLQSEQWEGLYLNYAVWQLLGRTVPEKCLPGFTGIKTMNSETATRILSFYVNHQRHLAKMRELKIEKAKIIGIGGCEACMALKDRTFRLDDLPELPYKDCTCDFGCRCTAISVLPWSTPPGSAH